MEFSNNQWTCSFVAKNTTEQFKLNPDGEWYGYKLDVPVGSKTQVWVNSNDGNKYKFTGLKSGSTYNVTLTHASDVSCYIYVEEKVEKPAFDWDYSGNENPSEIKLNLVKGNVATISFSYDASQSDYKWVSEEFAAKDGYINFTLDVWNSDKTEMLTIGQNVGSGTVGAETTVSGNPTGSNFYQSGLTSGKKYRVEIAGAGVNSFKFRVVEVKTETAQKLYLYSTIGPKQIGEAMPDADGKYTFTADFDKDQHFVLSLNEKATTWTGVESNNGRFNPLGDKNVPGENISFVCTTSDGSWKTTKKGTYTITVDWDKKLLTATCVSEGGDDFDGPASLYLYGGTPWAVFLGQAAADADGVFHYKVKLSAGQHIGLSTNANASDWNSMQNNGNKYYSPGEDVNIVSGALSDFKEATSGAWKAEKAGTYTISVDWANKKFSATYEEPIPAMTHMPLTSADFANGKKHYFIVGARMGEWRLQPEWELKQNGNELVLNNRYFYNSDFAIAVVNNYQDYINHRYTYYDEGREFYINDAKLSSDGDLSKNGHRLELKKGVTTAVGNTFYAAFDGNRANEPYYQGRGAFIKEVKVSLNGEGLPTSMTFTKGTTEEAAKYRVFTLVGDNIYNRNYCNATDGGNTPLYDRGYSKDNGWQEGWIQFDPETNEPYVDGFGEYLYHTSYTPDYLMANPVQFNQPVGNNRASDFSFTSNEVQFVEYRNLPNLDKDPYKDFYGAFSGTETIANNDALKSGEGYNFTVKVENYNDATTPTADWNCYVVRDMWVAGKIKFWTGWGGNSTSETNNDQKGAIWFGPNGGPDIDGGKCKDVKGFDINAGLPATLYKNVRNRAGTDYQVSDGAPVYFNRVVLWFNNTDGVNASYIQFIQESAGPAIFAEVRENKATGKKNFINYNWYLNEVQDGQEAQAELQVLAYEITRYRVVDNVKTQIGYPEGEKVDISGEGVKVKDLYKETAGNYAFTSHLDTGIIEDRGFAPGLYQYDIYVTYEGGARKLAWSNIVAIYDDELVVPDAVAMQLVELRDAYTDAYETDHASGKETMGTTKQYLTYRPNDNANFYVMDMEEKEIVIGEAKVKVTVPKDAEMVDAAKAIEFLNNHPDQYWWTSDYYVRCLDYNEYARVLQGYIDGGLIKDQSVPNPTLRVSQEIKFTDASGEEQKVEETKAYAQPFDFDGQKYYSAIVKRGGNLADATFDVELTYTYVNSEGKSVPVKTTAATQIDPVTPRPFDPLYRYVYDRPTVENPSDYQWGKILVPTKPWKNATTEDAINNGDLKEVYVKFDENFDARTFNLQVDFYRPNVNKDIYTFYDIQYNVKLVNNDNTVTKVPLDMDAVLHDVDTDDANFPNRYRMEFKGLHPRNGIYPTVSFVKTEYVPNEKADAFGGQYKSQTGNFGDMLVIDAVRSVQVNYGTGLEEVHLGKIQRKDGSWDWMYKGHKDFNDDDEELVPDPENNKYEDTAKDAAIKPLYYLIELQLEDTNEESVYEFLVPHVPGHKEGETVVDPTTGLVLNDTDPLIGTYIGKGFKTDATPTVWVTAIYMFDRSVNGTDQPIATNFNRLEVESIKFNNNGGAISVAKAPAARVKEGVSNSDLAQGNQGDLPDTGTDMSGESVFNMSQPDNVTGYNAYIAVRGASYSNYSPGNVTGVENVLAPGEDGEVVYYNLQGMRIDEPTTAGVYLRVQGKEVSKVVVK